MEKFTLRTYQYFSLAMIGQLEVEANSLEEAKEIALSMLEGDVRNVGEVDLDYSTLEPITKVKFIN